MSKTELTKKLKSINLKIDNLVIAGKSFKHLSAEHARIAKLLNN